MVNLLLHDLQFHPLKVFHILFAPGLYSLFLQSDAWVWSGGIVEGYVNPAWQTMA